MELNALLALPAVLPSQPRVVALLMSELAHAEPNLRRATQLFAADPALAARLLEQANSPALGAQQICGVPEALALLDTAQLRALVGSAPLGTALRTVPGIQLPQFWRYSCNTAKLARSLAGSVQHNQQAAYTAGLLHGLGELVLHQAEPQRLAQLNTVSEPFDLRRAPLEQHIFGYCYSHVSAALAQRWQLPAPVVDALHYQSAPFDQDGYEPLAGVLHLAAWRARARQLGLDDRAMAVSFPDQVALALGLDIDMVLQQDPIDWSVQPEGEVGDFA